MCIYTVFTGFSSKYNDICDIKKEKAMKKTTWFILNLIYNMLYINILIVFITMDWDKITWIDWENRQNVDWEKIN